MRVWVFVQYVNNNLRADVFRTEATARQTVDTYIRVNWPADIPMPADKRVARRQFSQVRRDIVCTLREVEVRDGESWPAPILWVVTSEKLCA